MRTGKFTSEPPCVYDSSFQRCLSVPSHGAVTTVHGPASTPDWLRHSLFERLRNPKALPSGKSYAIAALPRAHTFPSSGSAVQAASMLPPLRFLLPSTMREVTAPVKSPDTVTVPPSLPLPPKSVSWTSLPVTTRLIFRETI